MLGKVGVLGSGSFGLTVSTLLSKNVDVLMYTRNKDLADQINTAHSLLGYPVDSRVKATISLEEVCKECDVLFPVVPSSVFRSMMQLTSPYLRPDHIMIHATKGLDISRIKESDFLSGNFDRYDVNTMTEVITQETNVIRVGCLSGPNLAREILQGLPAATLIASEFDEVIKVGQDVMASKAFAVFGSHDLKGAEIAGAYKNIIAIASGMGHGLELGKNMQALLITRGLNEMVDFGIALGVSGQAFLGVAGIGDMIATAMSSDSRNFTFGYRFAKQETLSKILESSSEVIEGVNTLKIIHQLALREKIAMPITYTLYKVIFEGVNMRTALTHLMSYSYINDVDFQISKGAPPKD
jgi:glycerol-3-phosphate dehydrogenase (NAD(P)+)